jgi:hypothetical protein
MEPNIPTQSHTKTTITIGVLVVAVILIGLLMREKKTVPLGLPNISDDAAREVRKELVGGSPSISEEEAMKIRAQMQGTSQGSVGQTGNGGAPALSEAEIERIRKELSN